MRGSSPRLPRRTVVRAGVAGGAAALVGLPVLQAGCGDEGAKPLPGGPIAAGDADDVAMGSVQAVRGENAFIARDARGFYAMTAVCTHAACRVIAPALTDAVMICPCHGSMFNRNGAVTRGPASAALQHYQVDVGADGQLTIRGDIPVAADVRTAAPAAGT